MGIRSSYLSEIELGKRNITVLMLLRLARALDIPVTWLLVDLDIYAHAPPSETSAPRSSRALQEETLPYIMGATIRQYRQQRQITQPVLATMTGMSTSHICQIELGNRSVSLRNLVSIAAAFEIHMSSLLPLDSS